MAGLWFGDCESIIAETLSWLNAYDQQYRIRAANAVATLAFGLMGSLVGLMAFRASAAGDGAKGP